MKNLALERPLAVFDLETTGTSPSSDRIVEICVAVLAPGGSRNLFTRRVNPGRPIPPAATAVHGIGDADVADAPSFREVAPELVRLLEGCDLAGFNVISYDLPLIQAEFQRCNVNFSVEGRRIVDAQRIFHLKEPRTLSAAVKFYTGREHEGAHGAEADVLATVDVLDAQVGRYQDLPRDVEGLAGVSRPSDWADSQGKLGWSAGEMVLRFGKHRDRPIRDLVRTDAGYLEWILDSDFPADTKGLIRDALDGNLPEPPEGQGR
jgi:DNA polymerase-3 subunit epsilon